MLFWVTATSFFAAGMVAGCCLSPQQARRRARALTRFPFDRAKAGR